MKSMENSKNIAKTGKPKFSVAITTPTYQNLIRNTLGDIDTSKRFIAAISSAVATTPALQECTAGSIVSGALLGESLKLSHSPQIGHYYLMPFKNNKEKTTEAQFVLGYKGYIQLAIRSGYYKKLNVIEIKEGELNRFDPLTEEIDVTLIEDADARESSRTIGYYAMFEYVNGFRKAIYWSKEKMLSHADKYSPAFSKDATNGKYPKVSYADYEAGNYAPSDEWKYSSFWYKDFDAMAKKTMLRQLIGKWGVMSIEMQTAFNRDNAVGELNEKNEIVFDEAPIVNDSEYINEAIQSPEMTEAESIPIADDGDLFDD